MSAHPTVPHCPFCLGAMPPKASACAACGAQRQARRSMSPLGFYLFVLTWALCAGAGLWLAARVALQPWRVGGEPPAYALRVLGVREAPPPSGACRVETLESDGRTSVRWVAGSCDGSAGSIQAGAAALQPAASSSTLRAAAVLHSALVLGAAIGWSWLLLRLLRPVFQKRPPPGWVRRSVA